MKHCTWRGKLVLGAVTLLALLLSGRDAPRPPWTQEAQALWGGDAGQVSRDSGRAGSSATHEEIGTKAHRTPVG